MKSTLSEFEQIEDGSLQKKDRRFDKIELEVFSDEIMPVTLSTDNSRWLYIGTLFVPIESKNTCLSMLNNLRCKENRVWYNKRLECPNKCEFHDKNNTEIHYKTLHKSNERLRIAKDWINYLNRFAARKSPSIYINILGLNLSNMDLASFGDTKNKNTNTIYNRFYRTVLTSGFNYFFKDYKRIVINRIYHDKGSQESHKFFPWHPIYKTIKADRIEIKSKKIEFIDSDHRKSKKNESHFIQLIDIILGATYVCLHNPTKIKKKKKIGLCFKKILNTLLDRKKSQKGFMKGSYYRSNYYRKYQISFFPKNKMNIDEAFEQLDLEGTYAEDAGKEVSNFYYERPILLDDYPSYTLWKWMQ